MPWCWVPGVWLVLFWSDAFVLSGAGEAADTGSVVLFPSLEKEGQCPAFSGLVSFELQPSAGCREVLSRKLWKWCRRGHLKTSMQTSLPTACHMFLNVSGCHWGFWTRLNICGYFWKCLDVSGFAGWSPAGSTAPGGACVTAQRSALAAMFSCGAGD